MKFDLDEFAYQDSIIHRWDPRFKLAGLISLIFAFAFVETLRLVPIIIGITVVLYGLSRLPLSYWLSRFRYPGFFLLGIVFVLPFLSGETVIWQWGIITLRREGCLAVLLIAGRFSSILTLGLILLGTTPFSKLVKAMRSFGLPSIFADMMLLTYRYLFDVASNLSTMQQAMRLRGLGQATQRKRQSKRLSIFPYGEDVNKLASLTGTLFVRSYEQSERIYKAMRLRGYSNAAPAITSNSLSQSNTQTTRIVSLLTTHPWDAIALLGMLTLAIGLIVGTRV